MARVQRPDAAEVFTAPTDPDTDATALHTEAAAIGQRLTDLSEAFADNPTMQGTGGPAGNPEESLMPDGIGLSRCVSSVVGLPVSEGTRAGGSG